MAQGTSLHSPWDHTETKTGLCARAFVCAVAIELLCLTAMGWHTHWLAHPQKNQGMDESRFLETEVFEFPKDAHLVEKKEATPPSKAESAISTHASQKNSGQTQSAPEEVNQTLSGPDVASNHGPVAVYTPPPQLPSYLQNQNLNTYVLIDFFVTAQGTVTPRLIGSSGNEELDAIALAQVRTWQFRPAEQDHHAIDAKVRLRIIFEVR